MCRFLTRFSYDWANVPRQIQRWFEQNNAAFEQYLQLSQHQRTRVDIAVGVIVGRHPDQINDQNYDLVLQVWRERWNLLQLWAPDEDLDAPTAPNTPERFDWSAP